MKDRYNLIDTEDIPGMEAAKKSLGNTQQYK